MPPNPQGRRRGRQKGRESPLSEERLHPVSACLPAFAQGWLTGSLGPLSPERKPPPVCASASAAWPTSGLELARFKLFTPLGFSSKSPRANPHFISARGMNTAPPLVVAQVSGVVLQRGSEKRPGGRSHCVTVCAGGGAVARLQAHLRAATRHCPCVGANEWDRQVKDRGRVCGPGFGSRTRCSARMAEPLEF